MNRKRKRRNPLELRGTVMFHTKETEIFCVFDDRDKMPSSRIHVLEDGDLLTIYSPHQTGRVLWRGNVRFRQGKLRGNTGVFLQTGVSAERWTRWLTRGMPATLVPASAKEILTRVQRERGARPKQCRGFLVNFGDMGLSAIRAFQDASKTQPGKSAPDGGPMYSLEGLHELRGGDILTVYDKKDESRVLWRGEIDWAPLHTRRSDVNDPITRDRRKFQWGVPAEDWYRWFRERFPATLIKGEAKPHCSTCRCMEQ